MQYKKTEQILFLDDLSSSGSLEVRELLRFRSDLTQSIPVYSEIGNVSGKFKLINCDTVFHVFTAAFPFFR